MSPSKDRTRRFGSIAQAAKDLARLARVSPELWRVYRGGITSRMREQIMVAVSQTNSCAGCSQAHQRWALRAGVSDSELGALGLEDLSRFDPPNRAAVIYAVERSETGFRGSAGSSEDPEVAATMARYFTADETVQVDAIARAITFANLSVGTVEAFRERLTP